MTVPACSSDTLTNVLPHRNAMPQIRTRHSTLSQYTDTGPTWRFAIHWFGTSHWYTQIPIFKSWVRPDREIYPRLSTYTAANAQLYNAGMVVISQKLGRKFTVPNLGLLVCESITLSARPQLLLYHRGPVRLVLNVHWVTANKSC